MSREAWVATLISFAVNLVLFGLGAAALLALPGLPKEAQLLLPVLVLAGALLAPYVAWVFTCRQRSEQPASEDQDRPNESSSRMMSSSPR